MHTYVKVVLILLLLVCLLPMPYGYYQLVRFIAMAGFSILAFHSNKTGQQTELFLYVALAILFQPILKISLGRTLWNVVDVLVSIGLLGSMFRKSTTRS